MLLTSLLSQALKLRQQQLQDLRRTLAKELKPAVVPDPPQDSGQGSTTALDPPPPPAVIPHNSTTTTSTSNKNNSHSSSATTAEYKEHVNFQYLKSVLYKYITDPGVSGHLTRVVGTILELSDEEKSVLERVSSERKSTSSATVPWLPGN
jgi:hypothetical protein